MKFYLINFIFYTNIFNCINSITVKEDSWLWPNEVESNIDERQFIMAQNVISSSKNNVELAMRQDSSGIVYEDNPLLISTTAQQFIRRNSSAWKKLKINNGKPPDFMKPMTSSNSASHSQNLDYANDKKPSSNTAAQTPTLNVQRDSISFPEDHLVRRKAELKCAAYSKAFENKDVWIHPLVGTWPFTPSPKKNGSTNNRCRGIQNPLIINGLVAQPGEFPHMAALGFLSANKEASFLCGGSLISNQWVLTAAHCTHGPSGPPKVVRVGARHLGDAAAGKLIQVQEIIRHPSYNPPMIYADLALLKLNQTVQFGSLIRPACLYTEFDTTPNQAWASGWGVTGIGEEQSNELLKVRLDVVDNVDCALKLNRSIAIPRGIVPSMLCAGDIGGEWQSDTCQGDSGGPLQILHPQHKCLYQIIGITSFGRLCALKNSPGVYTRVSHYLEWIESVVWPDKNR